MADKEKPIANKANEDILNTLHQLVAADLMRRIQSGEASVQELNAAIKYLKDNEITADIQFSKPLQALEHEVTVIGELPFLDEEDEDEENMQ